MEWYKRSYVQCRSGRVAGSLTHTVMPVRKKPLGNKSEKATNLEAVVKLDASDENINQFFMKKRCTVLIENSPAIAKIFNDLSKLRKRKQQDYAELSVSLVDDGSKNEKHVPIYQQLNPNNKEKHTNSDLYEFDSDSENVKKKKRRKVRKSADDSVGFEKGMKETMHTIIKNFKKNQVRRQRRNHPIKRNVVQTHGAQTSQHNVSPKAIEKQFLNEEVELLGGAQHKINLPEIENYVTVDSSRVLTPNDFPNENDSSSGFLGSENVKLTAETMEGTQFDDFLIEVNCKIIDNAETAEAKDKTTNNPETIIGLFDEDTVSESDLFGFSEESHASAQKTDETTTNDIKPSMETVDAFGFDNESTEPPSEKAERINIISDVVINPKLGVISYKDFRRPNANSTMVLTHKPKRSSSPWRPDLGIIRNPYLLQFKSTLLPNYNQEMVLNSSISDKSCLDTSKTPNETSKILQSSILKYFSTSKSNQENEVMKESSLFDASDFSPIKSLKVHDVEDKENLSPQKTSTALKKIKRDILGQNTGSNRIPLSPLGNIMNYSKQEDIENYFGFDSIMEEDKENMLMKRKKSSRTYFNKPVRVDDVKQTVKNKVHFEGQPNSKEFQKVKDDVVEKESLVENNVEQAEDLPLRLFEDLDDEAPIRQYVPKRMRRRRQLSFVSENSDDENDHHKHKKKSARTKEEEEEFEQWATAFNSMCQEVNEYALEIE